nr:splicing factor 3B subunit 4-like [Aegilops tauschii subsp. strangulata]
MAEEPGTDREETHWKKRAAIFLKKPIHSLPTAFFTQAAPDAAALPPTPHCATAPSHWLWGPPHPTGPGRCPTSPAPRIAPPCRPIAPPHLAGHGRRHTPPASQAAPPHRPRALPRRAGHGRRPTPPAPRAA